MTLTVRTTNTEHTYSPEHTHTHSHTCYPLTVHLHIQIIICMSSYKHTQALSMHIHKYMLLLLHINSQAWKHAHKHLFTCVNTHVKFSEEVKFVPDVQNRVSAVNHIKCFFRKPSFCGIRHLKLHLQRKDKVNLLSRSAERQPKLSQNAALFILKARHI